jgi:RimJ/RimL family protein N-acetyltransferase
MVDVPDLVGAVVPAGRLRGRPQPELFVDELTLRPWQLANAPSVVRAYQDAAIQQWHARSMTAQEAEEWVASWATRWQAETGAGWAVWDDQGVLARMSLRGLDLAEGVGEAAYWVLPEARGRSVAPRALRAMSAWLFIEVGLHRIELAHSVRNTGSCQVAIKAGFPLEGTKRAGAIHLDGWHDMHLHARLQTDEDPASNRLI